MPYANNVNGWWSGYFTSRPTVKRFIRLGNSLLQSLRQLETQFVKEKTSIFNRLRAEVSLVQHHDAITGTEKQFVSNDYVLRLYDAAVEAEKNMNQDILANIFPNISENPFHFCLLSNVSICEVTTTASSSGEDKKVEVLVYNPLPHAQTSTISVPITSTSGSVTSIDGKHIFSEIFHTTSVYDGLKQEEAPRELVFQSELKALEMKRFLLKLTNKTKNFLAKEDFPIKEKEDKDEVVILENEFLKLDISKTKGKTLFLTNKKQNNLKIPLKLTLQYYIERGGAYVFAPRDPAIGIELDSTSVRLQKDSETNKIRRITIFYGEWGSIEYQLNEKDETLGLQWTIGPISIDDDTAKNIFIDVDTSGAVESSSKFYHDCNGLEFIKRTRNKRDNWDINIYNALERVAGNYYPITTGMFIKDEKTHLGIVTDRAQGASSTRDGQLEVMLHRRLLLDDKKGVHEALNETETFEAHGEKVEQGLRARGKFHLIFEKPEDGIEKMRKNMEKMYVEPLIAFRPFTNSAVSVKKEENEKKITSYGSLPENVGLTTVQVLSEDCQLIRLTHLYGKDENSKWSLPVKVDLKEFIQRRRTTTSADREEEEEEDDEVSNEEITIEEMALDGIHTLEEKENLRKNSKFKITNPWETEDLDQKHIAYSDQEGTGKPRKPIENGSQITLQAVEMRAFRICFGDGLSKLLEKQKQIFSQQQQKEQEKEETTTNLIKSAKSTETTSSAGMIFVPFFCALAIIGVAFMYKKGHSSTRFQPLRTSSPTRESRLP